MSFRLIRPSYALVCALSSLIGSEHIRAEAQLSPRVTLSIGSAPGLIQVGDSVDIPVVSSAVGGSPSTFLHEMSYDSQLLVLESIRLGDGVPAGKELFHVVDETPGSPIVSLRVIVLGFDAVPVPNGPIFVATFEVLDEGSTGQIPLTAIEGSAASPEGEPFTVVLEDGAIDLTCPLVNSPSNVSATDGDVTGVNVTWGAVVNASQYRVYRSATNNPDTAAPISPWLPMTNYLDATAPRPQLVTLPGCNAGTEVRSTVLYYFVKARARADCESLLSSGDAGHVGGNPAKSADWYGEGVRVAPHAPLRIPLAHPEGIDGASIAGEILMRESAAAAARSAQGRWEGGVTDGYLSVYPDGAWLLGEVVTVVMTASTLTGEPVGPLSVTFLVDDAAPPADERVLEESLIQFGPNAAPMLAAVLMLCAFRRPRGSSLAVRGRVE